MDFEKKRLGCDLLIFDLENPRLFRGDGIQLDTEVELIQSLNDISDLSELLFSICKNGYLDVEPLIVLKNNYTEDQYIVLEGNRRLASLKLLSDEKLARMCNITIPEECIQKITNDFMVNTILVKNRHDADSYIAFKHVNGAFRWESYAKAKFVTNWYIREFDSGITIDKIAKSIGDNNQTIRSFIGSMLLLEQAEKERVFSISDKYSRGKFGFSHLYTALSRKEYMDYLGLKSDWDAAPDPEPIKTERQKQKLGEVLNYIYGSRKEGQESLIKSQNPDLKNLGMVLNNPAALAVLKADRDLNRAYAETEEGSKVFAERAIDAYLRVHKLQEIVHKYEGEEHVLEKLSEMAEIAKIIYQIAKIRQDEMIRKEKSEQGS